MGFQLNGGVGDLELLRQQLVDGGVEVLAQRLVMGKCLLRALHAGLFCLGQARLRCAAQGEVVGAALLVAGIGFFRHLGGFHLPHVIAQQPYVDAAALIQKLAWRRAGRAGGVCGHGPDQRPEDGSEQVFQGALRWCSRKNSRNH